MKIIYITILLAIAGCQSRVSQHDTNLEIQWKAVTDAQAQVDAEKPKCTKGKSSSSVSPKEYLRATKCITKLIEEKVVPVTPYPEPLKKMLYTNLENAALYSQGKIIYEQVEARGQLAISEWQAEVTRLDDEVRQGYAAQDAEDRAKVARALEGFEPRRPVYTTCSRYGSTTQCRSQ